MTTWRSWFGRDRDESAEQHVRRLAGQGLQPGYLRPVLPSLVELYDRTSWLHDRVLELEARVRQLDAPSPDHGQGGARPGVTPDR